MNSTLAHFITLLGLVLISGYLFCLSFNYMINNFYTEKQNFMAKCIESGGTLDSVLIPNDTCRYSK